MQIKILQIKKKPFFPQRIFFCWDRNNGINMNKYRIPVVIFALCFPFGFCPLLVWETKQGKQTKIISASVQEPVHFTFAFFLCLNYTDFITEWNKFYLECSRENHRFTRGSFSNDAKNPALNLCANASTFLTGIIHAAVQDPEHFHFLRLDYTDFIQESSLVWTLLERASFMNSFPNDAESPCTQFARQPSCER